jgi:hypothetical protein
MRQLGVQGPGRVLPFSVCMQPGSQQVPLSPHAGLLPVHSTPRADFAVAGLLLLLLVIGRSILCLQVALPVCGSASGSSSWPQVGGGWLHALCQGSRDASPLVAPHTCGVGYACSNITSSPPATQPTTCLRHVFFFLYLAAWLVPVSFSVS